MQAKRRMKCDMILRQMHIELCQGPLTNASCRYLSEVGQHVRTSFAHFSEEDNRCVENTWRKTRSTCQQLGGVADIK